MSDDLHRWSCDAAVSGSLSRCDCDGPTALADLRERLAAAIEARANYCSEECLTCVRCVRVGALYDAASIVRDRP